MEELKKLGKDELFTGAAFVWACLHTGPTPYQYDDNEPPSYTDDDLAEESKDIEPQKETLSSIEKKTKKLS